MDTFAKVSMIVGGLMIGFVVLGSREFMVSQADHAFIKRVFWCGLAIAVTGPLLATIWTYVKKQK